MGNCKLVSRLPVAASSRGSWKNRSLFPRARRKASHTIGRAVSICNKALGYFWFAPSQAVNEVLVCFVNHHTFLKRLANCPATEAKNSAPYCDRPKSYASKSAMILTDFSKLCNRSQEQPRRYAAAE